MVLTPWHLILIATGILFGVLLFITLNRYIAYKERVALARLGFSLEDMNREAAQLRRGNRGVLWGGVITFMSGVALLLGLSTLGQGIWLLGGLLPLFVGLGMMLIYFVTLGGGPTDLGGHGARGHDEGAELSDMVWEPEGNGQVGDGEPAEEARGAPESSREG